MTVVKRRILNTTMTPDKDGKIRHIEVLVQYEQDDALHSSRLQIMKARIQLGLDDMTPGDVTSLTAMANRINAMIERKDPLIHLREK